MVKERNNVNVNYTLVRACDGEELRMYLYLKLYSIENNGASPPFKAIMRALDISKYTTIRIIKKMESRDRLEVKREIGKDNIYNTTWYDKMNKL